MRYLFFKKGKTGKTGSMLARLMRIRTQRSYKRRFTTPNVTDKIVRWGSTEVYNQYHSGELNSVESIEKSSNKFIALEMMSEAGVSVPWFTDNIRRDYQTKIKKYVGRDTYHQGGSNFRVSMGEQVKSDYSSTHWLELIPIYKEWRVHVFRGEIIGVSRKTDEGVSWRITNKYTRNHSNGWRFIRCDLNLVQPRLKQLAIEAVRSLGLDFGAVDIILSDGTESTSRGGRRYYVLEVNSAPSLEKGSTILSKYIEKIEEWFMKNDRFC